jgi:hypothetical protein
LIRKPEHCVLPQKSTTSVKGEISHVSLLYFNVNLTKLFEKI